ncbi:hypothetical protein HDG38_007061 [Paraburkholderia sp. WSM4177]|nr:hypothetical protein [Paraburkholderia sp. WSM4177]MBB5488796.1 hypothetical protein [Paraburkholderia sp. WSM4180]
MAKFYRHWNNMSWPAPGPDLSDLVRALTYGEPTKNELLVCASVINAYTEFVEMSAVRRSEIVRELRKGPALSIVTSASDCAKDQS